MPRGIEKVLINAALMQAVETVGRVVVVVVPDPEPPEPVLAGRLVAGVLDKVLG